MPLEQENELLKQMVHDLSQEFPERLTLLDQFALAIAGGLSADPNFGTGAGGVFPNKVASMAYEVAQKLIVRRAENSQESNKDF